MSRAYYTDSYTLHFDAVIVEAGSIDDRPFVTLNPSYFYPTSGGQPHDTGALSQMQRTARVVDVIEREQDGAVLHVLDRPLAPGPVTAEIDRPRRLDHMQHHTGQHILSQALLRVAEAETVGFHLSEQTVTIDLDRPDVTAAEIAAAESLSNRIVLENRVVSAREVSRSEAEALPLRKLPPGRDGRLRLVEIAGFDLTACGGTHVAHTGEVGPIKIVKTERRGESTRVEFLCGGRALADYGLKHEIVRGLNAALTTGQADLLPAVLRLQDESKQLRGDLRLRESALLELEAGRLLDKAEARDGYRLLLHVFADRPPGEVRKLAAQIVKAGEVVALLGVASEGSHLIFCRSADAPGSMAGLIRPALAALGGRGGGNETMAQGGGPPAGESAIAEVLISAAAQLPL